MVACLLTLNGLEDIVAQFLVAGSGARLFEGYRDSLPLRLAHSRAHGNGVVALHYTPAA